MTRRVQAMAPFDQMAEDIDAALRVLMPAQPDMATTRAVLLLRSVEVQLMLLARAAS